MVRELESNDHGVYSFRVRLGAGSLNFTPQKIERP